MEGGQGKTGVEIGVGKEERVLRVPLNFVETGFWIVKWEVEYLFKQLVSLN